MAVAAKSKDKAAEKSAAKKQGKKASSPGAFWRETKIMVANLPYDLGEEKVRKFDNV